MATPIPKNRASFELSELESVGRLVGPSRRIVGITSDSRSIAPGELFVALRGESFDGHRFASAAIAAGAAALLVSDASVVPEGASAIIASDTLAALGEIARIHRRRWSKTVVGITGSAGKTTTKELVRAALAATGLDVHATRGNLNNRVGVPMTIFELEDHHDVAVIEMGTSEAGEIRTLASIAEPDVAVITSIGLSHAAGIGSVDDVAREKGALFEAIHADGAVVVNLDDDRVASLSLPLHRRVVRYGTSHDADVRLSDIAIEASGATAVVHTRNQSLSVRLAIPSRVALLNAAAAISVASILGRNEAEAALGLATAGTIEGRMHPIELGSGVLVVDDAYNANPKSMVAALESCAALAASRGGRLVVALGEMRELGEHARDAHVALGHAVVSSHAARMIAVGDAMEDAVRVVAQAGIETVLVADSVAAAAAVGSLRPNDVVLVKGSRSIRMERVVEALVASEASS